MWQPIPIKQLNIQILAGELELNDELLNFWDLIKIRPEKWEEKEMGTEGGGFWVVAIFGRDVIFYNDIEEGFNISQYEQYGLISDYMTNQYDLNEVINKLMERLKRNRNFD